MHLPKKSVLFGLHLSVANRSMLTKTSIEWQLRSFLFDILIITKSASFHFRILTLILLCLLYSSFFIIYCLDKGMGLNSDYSLL